MSANATSTLNQGQRAAAEGFFEFLFSDEKEMIIKGPPGTGKTHLMGDLIDRVMPQYFESCKLFGTPSEYNTVDMTSTTNKAAHVLSMTTRRPTQTIHSYLNLIMKDDLGTGKSNLVRRPTWTVHENKILFIDEASYEDFQLLTMINEGTHNCKIIHVGDDCQLAPVGDVYPPVFNMNVRTYELTEPVRNANQPALMAVCQQLRETVKTGVFKPIQCVAGVIDWVDDNGMQKLIIEHFSQQSQKDRILAYTNDRVIEYNDYIRDLRHLSPHYSTGELLVNNTAFRLGRTSTTLSVEEEVEITSQWNVTEPLLVDTTDNGQKVILDVRRTCLTSSLGKIFTNVPLPVDRQHHKELLKYYKKTKNWNRLAFLKNKVPDLRPRDAATVHKSQGSTYDTVFIDVEDLSTCTSPSMAARLLYVGFSRAQNRVVLYGKLADRYGGLIPCQ